MRTLKYFYATIMTHNYIGDHGMKCSTAALMRNKCNNWPMYPITESISRLCAVEAFPPVTRKTRQDKIRQDWTNPIKSSPPSILGESDKTLSAVSKGDRTDQGRSRAACPSLFPHSLSQSGLEGNALSINRLSQAARAPALRYSRSLTYPAPGIQRVVSVDSLRDHP